LNLQLQRLLLLFVLLLAATARPVDAWQPPAPDGAAAAEADPWGFEDEEQVETWQDVLRPQIPDIAATTAFLGFALFSFFRKSRALKYIALALSVAYLGVYKSQLVSITDVFRMTDGSLPELQRNITWYLFTGFTFVSTVIWGRVYCGRICAFGAFTQLMDAVLPKKLRIEPPLWLERRASLIKYGILATVLVYYFVTKDTPIYRYVEPFWMFTFSANAVLWTLLGLLLTATIVVRNMYCRFLCPLGATLGIISQVTTVLPIKRWSECKSCKICEKACEWGAIEGPKIIKSECVRCDDCERIYHDKKSCVHHLMITKKEKWVAAGIKGNQPVGAGSSAAL
jgi:NosR/NirI family transcriptional regulator, nitrous oxide reductase regulator